VPRAAGRANPKWGNALAVPQDINSVVAAAIEAVIFRMTAP
jgi:hypothetical protein